MAEDSDRHALFKAELIAALSDIEQKVKIDWQQFEARPLLVCFAISACWSWDALIRVCGVSDEIQVSEEPGSWDRIIREELRPRLLGISFDELATLGVSGFDFPSVILFAFIVRQSRRAGKEILRRLENLHVGKQLVFWIDRFPNFRVKDLLSVIQPPPAITPGGQKRYLSDASPNAFDDKEKADTQQGLSILAALEYYERLKAAVELKPVPVPFSPLAKTYPAPAAWEQAFPRIVQQEIEAQLTELIPVLDRVPLPKGKTGSMEKAPGEAFNLIRNEARKEQRWSVQKGEISKAEDQEDLDAEDDEEEQCDEKAPPLTIYIENTLKIHHDELERERPLDLELLLDNKKKLNKAHELYSKRLEALFDKYHTRQSNRPKIIKGLELHREKNLVQSAKDAKISKNILRPFVIELGLSRLKKP